MVLEEAESSFFFDQTPREDRPRGQENQAAKKVSGQELVSSRQFSRKWLAEMECAQLLGHVLSCDATFLSRFGTFLSRFGAVLSQFENNWLVLQPILPRFGARSFSFGAHSFL